VFGKVRVKQRQLGLLGFPAELREILVGRPTELSDCGSHAGFTMEANAPADATLGEQTKKAGFFRPASCYLYTTIAVSWERLSGRHVVGRRDSIWIESDYPRHLLSVFDCQKEQPATNTCLSLALPLSRLSSGCRAGPPARHRVNSISVSSVLGNGTKVPASGHRWRSCAPVQSFVRPTQSRTGASVNASASSWPVRAIISPTALPANNEATLGQCARSASHRNSHKPSAGPCLIDFILQCPKRPWTTSLTPTNSAFPRRIATPIAATAPQSLKRSA
jgi:hypothetical protein